MRRPRGYFKNFGFTLIEMIIVVAIIGIISSIVLVSLFGAREKARDVKRKAEIAQFGRLLTLSCYLPDDGEGEYDLVFLAEEIKNKYPKYNQYLSNIPKDPKTGTDEESKYIYIVNAEGTKCALYANLENIEETITLEITAPTPGGGTGVLKAENPGWNGTNLYFQYSN
jgi:prepilin-type N-terminal cleavage/methylation domain-containing protein